MTPDEMKKFRVELKKISDKATALIKKEKEMKEKIQAVEINCKHTWSQREYRPKTDDFLRTCTTCWKLKVSSE